MMAQKRSMGMRIKIAGEEELYRKLSELAQTEFLTEAVMAAGGMVLEEARDRVPVRTGQLQDSLTKSDVRRFKSRVTIDVGPDERGWYGRLVEIGTKRAPARPFLRPALDSQRRAIRATVTAIIRRGIERVARS